MANHKSALKRIRQNDKRRIHNRMYRGRARTLVKAARISIADGSDLEAARAATRSAIRDLDMQPAGAQSTPTMLHVVRAA